MQGLGFLFGPGDVIFQFLDARLRGHDETIGERLERDLATLLPLPATAYDASDQHATRVSSLSLVRYRTSDYSVPVAYGTCWSVAMVIGTCWSVAMYTRASQTTQRLFARLYLEGLATGDFEPVFRELVGETTALSANTVVRLKEHWGGEYEAWRRRPLGEHRYAYIWADGVYLSAGAEQEKTALLCVLGAREDGEKELLAVVISRGSDVIAGRTVTSGPMSEMTSSSILSTTSHYWSRRRGLSTRRRHWLGGSCPRSSPYSGACWSPGWASEESASSSRC